MPGKREDDTANLRDEFASVAEAYGLATESGDARRTNRLYDKLVRIAQGLRETKEGRDALLSLVSHPVKWVRLGAAALCLPFGGQKAVLALEELSLEPGFLGLDVEMTLQEWKAGRLKL